MRVPSNRISQRSGTILHKKIIGTRALISNLAHNASVVSPAMRFSTAPPVLRHCASVCRGRHGRPAPAQFCHRPRAVQSPMWLIPRRAGCRARALAGCHAGRPSQCSAPRSDSFTMCLASTTRHDQASCARQIATSPILARVSSCLSLQLPCPNAPKSPSRWRLQ
jgi:hypothetical protein